MGTRKAVTMGIIILILLVLYLDILLTLSAFSFKRKKKKTSREIAVDRDFIIRAKQGKLKAPVIEEKTPEVGVITRPSAKRLRILNDPKKKEEHDAFMGTLDQEPILRASREATDPSKKGYVAKGV